VLGEVRKDRVEGQMVKVTVFISAVMVEVDEILNVVVRPKVFDVLQNRQIRQRGL
jgi:hypothetical protein